MADSTRHIWKAAPLACAFGIMGLLAGCASVGNDGPPIRTQLLGEDTYLVLGKYSSVSDTMNVLKKQMQDRADKQCPGGWTKLAEGPNPEARMGGQIWKIHCTGLGMTNVPPPADSGVYVAPAAAAPAAAMAPQPASAAKPAAATQPDLLQMFTAAVMQAAPDLSEHAAQAIARAQLRSLSAAGMTVKDAAGHPVPLH